MDPKTTRGFLNNNPGNLDRSTAYVWNGEIRDPAFAQNDIQRKELTEGRFCVFTDAKHGIRAMAKNLTAYRNNYGCESTRDYINRWAPPNENDTTAYINAVAQKLGVRSTDFVDIGKLEVMCALIEAIIRVECAGNPYENGEIEKGVSLA